MNDEISSEEVAATSARKELRALIGENEPRQTAALVADGQTRNSSEVPTPDAARLLSPVDAVRHALKDVNRYYSEADIHGKQHYAEGISSAAGSNETYRGAVTAIAPILSSPPQPGQQPTFAVRAEEAVLSVMKNVLESRGFGHEFIAASLAEVGARMKDAQLRYGFDVEATSKALVQNQHPGTSRSEYQEPKNGSPPMVVGPTHER